MKYIPVGKFNIIKSEHVAAVLKCLEFDDYKVEEVDNEYLQLYLGIDDNADDDEAVNKFIKGYIRLSELIQEELMFVGYPVENILTYNFYYGMSLDEIYNLINET